MADTLSAVLGLALLLATVLVAWRATRATGRAVRRLLAGSQPENVLTNIVAGLATSVSAQGMFRFFTDRLAMPWWMQPEVFAVFELAQLACALRARRNIRKTGKAGVDGALVWVMSAISAVLSATDSDGFAALARMVFPFAAAVLWERGLSSERKERRRARPDEGIQSRLTVERLLVWLRLAEPSGRTASDVDVHRRLHRVARAVQRLRALEQAGAGTWWRQRLARRRLTTMVAQADEHAGLATDPARQAELLAHIAVLVRAPELTTLTPAAPWAPAPVRPERPRLVRVPRDPQLAAAERELWREVHALRPGDVPGRVPGEDRGEHAQEHPQEHPRDEDDERDDVPEELRDLVDEARKRFHWEIRRGVRPSVRDLKKALRIGTDNAREVQPYLGVPEQERGA